MRAKTPAKRLQTPVPPTPPVRTPRAAHPKADESDLLGTPSKFWATTDTLGTRGLGQLTAGLLVAAGAWLLARRAIK